MTVFAKIASTLPRTAVRGLFPLFMLAACSVGSAVVVYGVCLSPAQIRLAMSEQAYQSAKQAQARVHASRVQQLRAKEAQRQLDQVRVALPTEEEFTSLAMACSELAKSEHVAIPGMGYDVKKSDGTFPEKATIAFRATGDYAAIYRFIHRLETVEPYVVIESLDVASEDKTERGLRVAVNIKVATYLRRTTGEVKTL